MYYIIMLYNIAGYFFNIFMKALYNILKLIPFALIITTIVRVEAHGSIFPIPSQCIGIFTAMKPKTGLN